MPESGVEQQCPDIRLTDEEFWAKHHWSEKYWLGSEAQHRAAKTIGQPFPCAICGKMVGLADVWFVPVCREHMEEGRKVQKISKELAEAIRSRARELIDALDRGGLADWEELHGAYERCYLQAIADYVAKPGDHEFCWPGEGKRCYCYRGEGMTHMWPEVWEGPMKCTHLKAKPGFCPLELHRCGGRLMPVSFIVEDSQSPDGYRHANGFRCEKCGEEVISAQEARRLEQMAASDKVGRGE